MAWAAAMPAAAAAAAAALTLSQTGTACHHPVLQPNKRMHQKCMHAAHHAGRAGGLAAGRVHQMLGSQPLQRPGQLRNGNHAGLWQGRGSRAAAGWVSGWACTAGGRAATRARQPSPGSPATSSASTANVWLALVATAPGWLARAALAQHTLCSLSHCLLAARTCSSAPCTRASGTQHLFLGHSRSEGAKSPCRGRRVARAGGLWLAGAGLGRT